MSYDEFVATIYDLCNQDKGRESIALVLDYFDDRMWAGKFDECDFVLQNIDVNKLLSSTIVGFLGYTFWVKLKLPSRSSFYKRSMKRVTKLKGWCYARELLKRYR